MPFNPGETNTVNPPFHAFDITPHDTNELSNITRSIYVGSAGNVKITTPFDETVTYVNVIGRLPIVAKIIHLTDTTASDIVGEY